MSAYRSHAIGRHEDRDCAKSRAMYRELCGPTLEAIREREIAERDQKDWRGHTVYRLRCNGDYGKGPHEVWLPERVLWALIDFDHYRCPYHR